MKTLVKFLAAFLIIFSFTVSCGRDDDEDTGTGTGTGTGNTVNVELGKCIINANITGNLSKTYNSELSLSNTVNNSGMLAMVSLKLVNASSASSFQITIPMNITPGTYTITKITEFAGYVGYTDNSLDQNSTYLAGINDNKNFSLTVSSNSGGQINGTFTGDMMNLQNKKINVTGDFKAGYK